MAYTYWSEENFLRPAEASNDAWSQILSNFYNYISDPVEDLLIEVDSSVGGGSITIDGQFGFYAEDIDEIVFADSSTFDIFSQNYTLQGIHLAETLTGVEQGGNNDFDDTIYGHGGDDTITGLHGADNLYGGDGDDAIYAAANDNAPLQQEKRLKVA